MEEKMTKKEIKELRRMEKQERERMGKSGGGDLTKWLILGIGGILFLAAFVFIIFTIKQSKNKPVEIASTGFVRGSENAKVELVEFGDFQCPACKAYEPIVRKILEENDGKVRLLFKHFPLVSIHQNAMFAAKAANAAGNQDKFWEMHDWLYDHQEEWAGLPEGQAKEKIIAAAAKLKLNVERFKKDVNSKETEDLVNATQSEGIELGVASTPTFFINNKRLDPVPSDYEGFSKVIKEAIKNTK